MKPKKQNAKKDASKWVAIRTGCGTITGYIEMLYSKGLGYVTIPGASRFRNA